MATTSRGSRRQRFTRSRTQIRLTPDDLAILEHVGRYRFLRSTHLVKLLPHRPSKKLVERMGVLYHAGYLDRPRAQIDYYSQLGSSPMVYALGDCSGDVLPDSAEADWSEKNRTVKRPYIEHALMTADIMIAFEVAARTHPDLAFEDQHALRVLRPASHASPSWQLSASLTQRGRRFQGSVIPDAVFALQTRSTGRRRYFFLEADRGKMTIDASDLTQSSYRRKLAIYYAALRARQHELQFGFDNVRVLTVTTSDARSRSMIDVVHELLRCVPSGRFLFAELAAVIRADPIALLWNTNADPVDLMS